MEEILKSLPDPMKLDYSVFIVAALVITLIFILNALVFKPLMAILDERQKQIDEGLEAKKKSLKTVEESMAAYQERVIDARRNAQNRRNQILKESEMVRNEITNSAKEQSMGMIQAAVTDINKQVAEAKASLKAETNAIAQQIVSSILNRKLS